MKFTTGSVFGNRYTLGDRIAVGGMGEVWKATDQVLGREVAIKLLAPMLADQPGFTHRFREEARNTAQLSHGNIANVYDYGEDAGAHWLVMELVEGKPLSQIIKEEAPLEPQRVATILGQAASALQAAHDAGVIHRDVKPANILIRRDGTVKLTDFGISRAIDAAPITRTGEVMGTAQYISPEQAMGQQVGPESDLYALGVVGMEMLTGHRPFDEGSPVATAMAHIHTPPPPLPPGTPEPLGGVIMACLSKDPVNRPPSGREMAAVLRRPLGPPATATHLDPSSAATRTLTSATSYAQAYGSPTASLPRTGTQPGAPQTPRRRNPAMWLVPLLLVILVVAGVVLARSGFFGGSSPTPSPSLPSAPATPTTSSAPSTPTTTAPEQVTVDEGAYRGRTLTDVSAELSRLGLGTRVSSRQYSEQYPEGTVIALSPSGRVDKGSTIALTVSRGPKPAPTQAPTTPAQPSTSAPAPSTPTRPDNTRPTSGDGDGDTGPGTGGAGNNAGSEPGGKEGGGHAGPRPTHAPTAEAHEGSVTP